MIIPGLRLSDTARAVARSARWLLPLVLFPAVSCRVPLVPLTPSRMDEPNPDSVERVVFVIGDAGEALPGRSPVIARLQRDVEAWSGGLGQDSAVTVLFVGDNVYPAGVRSPGELGRADDTLRLRAQLDVVAGQNARARRTTAFFIAGNHDWGNLIGVAGLRRLRNQEELIDAARASGLRTRLLPAAGEAGPAVVDMGDRVRMIFLDTHWWLQVRLPAAKARVLQEVENAIRTANGRDVVMVAHHPFVSGGAHGGPVHIWEGLGIIWLLRQTGSLVQDLNSSVYKELVFGLRAIFARAGRPLLFVGGHDHSLQVLEDSAEDEPLWSLVSGAGSKSTEVSVVHGTRYADNAAGFMRVTYMTDGSVMLHVIAAPSQYATCDPATEDVPKCMEDGLAAFESVYATKLK